jgi:hypothetical protein
MVRVNLSSGAVIKLPVGTELMHIRIYNKGANTISVRDSSNNLIVTQPPELASFVYQGTEWIYYASY